MFTELIKSVYKEKNVCCAVCVICLPSLTKCGTRHKKMRHKRLSSLMSHFGFYTITYMQLRVGKAIYIIWCLFSDYFFSLA